MEGEAFRFVDFIFLGWMRWQCSERKELSLEEYVSGNAHLHEGIGVVEELNEVGF